MATLDENYKDYCYEKQIEYVKDLKKTKKRLTAELKQRGDGTIKPKDFLDLDFLDLVSKRYDLSLKIINEEAKIPYGRR